MNALVVLALLLPASLAALYYFGLTTLARFARRTIADGTPSTHFAILVPAHNEALSLPATLQSLALCGYPPHLRTIYVVADNCTDDTAAVARNQSAIAIERHDSSLRGKGYALAYALETILPTRPDAVLILDADAELARDALAIFAARLSTTAVVQGSIRTRNVDDGPTALVAAVGNRLDDAISAGRDRLGLRVPLRGSNMAFRRDVLAQVPWQCFGLTEDAEYSARLQAAGIRVRFEPQAQARSESPANLQVLTQQRRRWRAAIHPGTLIDSKPLVVAQLLLTTLVVAAIGDYLWWLAAIWGMTLAVYLPVLDLRSLSLLPRIPLVVAKLIVVTLGRRESTWQRTRRVAEG